MHSPYCLVLVCLLWIIKADQNHLLNQSFRSLLLIEAIIRSLMRPLTKPLPFRSACYYSQSPSRRVMKSVYPFSRQRWRWRHRFTCTATRRRSRACSSVNPTASSSVSVETGPASCGTSTGLCFWHHWRHFIHVCLYQTLLFKRNKGNLSNNICNKQCQVN